MRPSSRQSNMAAGQLTSGLRAGSSNRRSVVTEAQVHLQAPSTPRNRPSSFPERKNYVGQTVPEDEILSIDHKKAQESKRSKTPVIPAMQRESTSFGVFSNLAAHNKPKRRDNNLLENEVVSLNGRGPQSQMLKAVRNGDMKQITKLLESNPDMKFTFSDKDGSSPLHHAMYSGNDEVVKFILGKRPLVNMFNKAGKTALHIAASRGREQTVFMLLQNGANVNAQNLTSGNTVLHEAVSAGHKQLVDLFLGYDADASLTTSEDKKAIDVCNAKCTVDDLQALIKLRKENGLEAKEAGTSVTTFKTTGVIMEPRQITDQTCAICRRYRASCKMSTSLQRDEEVTSDEFSIRLGRKDINYPVFITFPINNGQVSIDEEVIVVTSDGQKILPSEIWRNIETHFCKFGTTIKQNITFIAVCRQRVEHILFNKQPTLFISEANPRVKVHLGKDCYKKTTNVSIKAFEVRDNMNIEEGDVVSSTPYYKIDSEEQLAKSVDIELPEPKIYGVDPGKVMVLTKDNSTENWKKTDHVQQEIDTHSDTDSESQRSVLFSVSSLPSYAVVVRCRQEYNMNSVVNEVSKTLQLIFNKTYTVCFLCLAKQTENEKKCSIVVECCEIQHADFRRHRWIADGYLEQQNRSIIDHINVHSKQTFKVSFCKTTVIKEDAYQTIEFHPKLINKMLLNVESNDNGELNGRVNVFSVSRKVDNQDENKNELLTSIDIILVAPQIKDSPRQSMENSESDSNMNTNDTIQPNVSNIPEIRVDSYDSDGENDKTVKNQKESVNILTNEFLGQLGEEIEDDWFKIFILMGVSFADIERILFKNAPEDATQQRIFFNWRDSQDNRDDIGIPMLLSALCKGGRRDVANTVQIKLKRWHSTVGDEDLPLYQWLCKAYQDSNIFVPSDYPKPMSDAYFVLMADEMVPSRELGLVLSLVNSEIDDIFECQSYIYPSIRVMKMLTLFRESMPNTIDALRKLIECMELLNYDNLRKYAIMCAKAWVKRTATRKDEPLRTQVDTLMKQMQ